MSQAALGDLLECSVCLEPLGSEHKVLPCQHTFCTRCIIDVKNRRQRDKQAQQMQQQRDAESASEEAGLLCPECRALCSVPLEKLPSNVILNRILEGIKSEKKSDRDHGAPKVKEIPPVTTKATATRDLHCLPSLSAITVPAPAPANNIPGNLSTNPFLNMIVTSTPTDPAITTPPSPAPMLPPKPHSSSTHSSSSATTFFPSPTPPTRPPSQHPKQSMSTPVNSSNSVATVSPATSSTSASAGHQIYRALYDYKPCKEDELELLRGQLYVVADKCRDGWYKGTTVEGLKSGVFPGNYVQHVAKPTLLQPSKADPTMTSSPSGQSLSSKTSTDDLIDLSEMSELTDLFCRSNVKKMNVLATSATSSSPKKAPPPPPSTLPPTVTGWATFPKDDEPPPVPPAAMETAGRRLSAVAAARRAVPASNPLPQVSHEPAAAAAERYRCIMSYPASGEYELELKVGDVVLLHKKREDGWCKGTLERTGQTGLFPITFVNKMR